jgi:putative CocE/NonD family hydrolase
MIHEKDVQITVRDGVKIAVRIYRPDGAGPFPALFAPSPYRYDNNELPALPMFLWRETGPIEWYVEQGYAYVHMDVRGTGYSQGDYRFFDKAEQGDLYDVIEWIGAQPWCNGKVGGIGQSYFCMSQWFMGIQNPPHLACLGAYDGLNDPYRYIGFPGGIEGAFMPYWYNASVRVSNLYPANGDHPRALPYDLVHECLNHPLYDDFWKERTAAEHLDKITVPVFSIGVFAKQDLHLAGNILGFHKVKGPVKLAITGTPTAFSSAIDFANVDFHKKYLLPFYDQHLKGAKTSYAERANVEYVVKNTGTVRTFETWPPPGVKHRTFFLQPGPSGTVTSLNDGGLDPALPSSDGGNVTYSYPHPTWVLGVVNVGPTGPDPARGVLTFTSKPLQADLEIAGNARLVVYGSTTRKDMDIIVKLSEQIGQPPDERARGTQPRYAIVAKGWLRCSHMERDAARSTDHVPFYRHDKVTPLTPGKIYKFEVPIEPIAWRFRKGNRIRVEICCGDSPVTDGLFFHLYRPDKIGADTIHHDAEHPSHIVLPVLPVE